MLFYYWKLNFSEGQLSITKTEIFFFAIELKVNDIQKQKQKIYTKYREKNIVICNKYG